VASEVAHFLTPSVALDPLPSPAAGQPAPFGASGASPNNATATSQLGPGIAALGQRVTPQFLHGVAVVACGAGGADVPSSVSSMRQASALSRRMGSATVSGRPSDLLRRAPSGGRRPQARLPRDRRPDTNATAFVSGPRLRNGSRTSAWCSEVRSIHGGTPSASLRLRHQMIRRRASPEMPHTVDLRSPHAQAQRVAHRSRPVRAARG
jgi:hypothetical protein